jgi:hypothetical protein
MMMPSRTLTAIAVIRYSEGSMSPGCAQWEIVRSIVSLQYWQRESCHLGATAENDESSRRLVSVETVTIALDDNAIRGPLRLAGKGKYARNASEELFHFWASRLGTGAGPFQCCSAQIRERAHREAFLPPADLC